MDKNELHKTMEILKLKAKYKQYCEELVGLVDNSIVTEYVE